MRDELRDLIVSALIAHEPDADDCDEGGLVCSDPRHLTDAILPFIAEARRQALADVIAHLRDRSLHLDPTAAAHHADWIERELGGERGE